MAKICGLIRTEDDQETIKEKLKVMVTAMRHDRLLHEEFAYFEKGGLAIITSAPKQAAYVATNSSCSALCGHVVGLASNNGSNENDEQPALELDVDDLRHLYEQQGQDILATLSGVFCFAYYNIHDKSLSLINDRYGFMPLYVYHDAQTFVFASEVKAILAILEQQELDWEASADFFYIGHMMGQKTLIQNVYALEAGQILTYANGTVKADRYHDFAQTPVLNDDEVSTEKLATLFIDAVRKRVGAGELHTLLLSGGFDSRLILGALDTLQVTPRMITLEHASERKGADGKLAVLMANALGMECDYRQSRKDFFASNDWLKAFYILDGMIPNLGLFISEIYPELDPSLGTVWDGLALDVVLGGSHQIPGSVRENVEEFIGQRAANRRLLRLILNRQHFHALDNTFMSRLQDEINAIPASENQFLYFLLKHRTRRRIAVNPHQLFAAKIDPMTPACDTHFLDYAMSIPSTLKLYHKLYISLLKDHFPRLSKVPIVTGSSLFRFDSDDLTPKKQNSIKKLRSKLRGSLAKVVKPVVASYNPKYRATLNEYRSHDLIVSILGKTNFERSCFNTKLLQRLFTSYRKGNVVLHKLFVLVFYMELWHVLFIDKDPSVLARLETATVPEEKPEIGLLARVR